MQTIEGEVIVADGDVIPEAILEGNRIIVRAILQYQLDLDVADAYALLESADAQIDEGDDTDPDAEVEPHYNALMVATAKDEARKIINDLAMFGYKLIKTEEKNIEHVEETELHDT